MFKLTPLGHFCILPRSPPKSKADLSQGSYQEPPVVVRLFFCPRQRLLASGGYPARLWAKTEHLHRGKSAHFPLSPSRPPEKRAALTSEEALCLTFVQL